MASKLSALLVQDRVVSFRQMDAAVQRQHKLGGRIGTNLLELGQVDEGILLYYLSKQKQIQAAERQIFAGIDPALLDSWPLEQAQTKGAVPVHVVEGRMQFLVTDGLSFEDVAAIGAKTGHQVEQFIVLEFRFQQLLQTCYALTPPERYAELVEKFPTPMSVAARAPTSSAASETPVEVPDFYASPDGIPGLAWTVPQLVAFCDRSQNRDELLLAVLGFVGKFFRRRMMWVAGKQNHVRGYAIQMPGAPQYPIQTASCEIPIGSPIERLLTGEAYYFGPTTDSGVVPFYHSIGIELPADCAVLPVRVGPRAAVLLVGDGETEPLNPRFLPVAFVIINRLAANLERLIRKQKLRQTSMVETVPASPVSDERSQSLAVRAAAARQATEILEAIRDQRREVARGVHLLSEEGWDSPDLEGFELPPRVESASHDVPAEESPRATPENPMAFLEPALRELTSGSHGRARTIAALSDEPVQISVNRSGSWRRAPSAAYRSVSTGNRPAVSGNHPSVSGNRLAISDQFAGLSASSPVEAHIPPPPVALPDSIPPGSVIPPVGTDLRHTSTTPASAETRTFAPIGSNTRSMETPEGQETVAREASETGTIAPTGADREAFAAAQRALLAVAGGASNAQTAAPEAATVASFDLKMVQSRQVADPHSAETVVGQVSPLVQAAARRPEPGQGPMTLLQIAEAQAARLSGSALSGSRTLSGSYGQTAASGAQTGRPQDEVKTVLSIDAGAAHLMNRAAEVLGYDSLRRTGQLQVVGFTRKREESAPYVAVNPGSVRQNAISLDVRIPGVLQPELIREPQTEAEREFQRAIVEASSVELIGKLNSADRLTSDAAFIELLNRGPRAYEALIDAFPGPLLVNRREAAVVADPQPIERHGPVLWLVGLQLASLSGHLPRVLQSENDDARYYGARLILQAADPRAIEAMIQLLFDRDEQVRHLALQYVERYVKPTHRIAALAAIRGELHSETSWRSEAAISAVSQLKDAESVQHLIELLEHKSDHTRQRAAQALTKITFQDHGINRRKWERWFERASEVSRDEWLMEAMVDKDWKVRDNAARELRTIARLVVNYTPDLDRQALVAAQRTVRHHLAHVKRA